MNTEMVGYLKVRIVVSLRFLLWYFSSFTSSEMWCCVPGWNCRCYEGSCTVDSSGIMYVVTWYNITQDFGLYEKFLACWRAVFDMIRIYSGVRCFVHKCRILVVTVTFIVHVYNVIFSKTGVFVLSFAAFSASLDASRNICVFRLTYYTKSTCEALI
jgi:hypothetical protein